jgi:hypothetical protein
VHATKTCSSTGTYENESVIVTKESEIWRESILISIGILGMLSKLFVRKSLTKRNEFPFVEALGSLDLMRMLPT